MSDSGAKDENGIELTSNIEVGSVPLSAVSDAAEDPEVLGFAVMSTTGEVVVPRDWLETQWEQRDLPDAIFPSETWSSSAYKRAMFHLLDDGHGEHYLNTEFGQQQVTLDVKKGSGNERHILANVWFDDSVPQAEELDIDEGGEWRQTTLGVTWYDSEDQDVHISQRIDEEHPLADIWQDLIVRIRQLFETHKVSHNGDDMRDVLYDFTRYESDSIPLRDGGAVYFVPANERETIESLAYVWDEMNKEHKLGGRRTEIRTIPVIDDTDRRAQIEERATKVVREEIDRVLEDAFETADDPDDETPEDEIISEIQDALGDHAQTAEVYNSLVGAKIEVRDILKDFAKEVSEESQQDLIESTLKRLDPEAKTDGGPRRDENGRFV